MAYSSNPLPQLGSGPFGAVPGTLSLPNPSSDLSAAVPGLGSLNTAASNDILSNLGGKLSPGTVNALQNASATFGVASGMPGSGLSWNQLYGNIAGAANQEEALGLSQLNPYLSQTSGTQTLSPSLQATIAGTNATNAAAPNPGASASYSAQMFNQYLNSLRGPAAGGTIAGNPATDPLTGLPNWAQTSTPDENPYSVYSTGSFSNLGQMPTS